MDTSHPPPLLLEASVHALIDEHMQTWLDNFVGRFASFERRFADLERRFHDADDRLVAVENVLPSLASGEETQRHARAIEELLAKLGGDRGIDAQLAELDATLEHVQLHVGGGQGLEARIEGLERAMPQKADFAKVERIHASLTGETSPQARLAKVETALSDQLSVLNDIVGRKVGRDELYFEMMARHMLVPPKSPTAVRRPQTAVASRALSSRRP
eukprot:CAMPEP_0171100626 /NCGR_PEP_ID=MMETSP0766_2-20121228/53067_1 /TAXON_ID=439317 /ORGANISM="Gambierdiscus australes, Strain CAWD 149" /LENGTH=215 /DNA_ID=CAMNT_0011560483 /DNA_START=62 /DNA_END=709 /DNA_ORIENTATION=-